MLLMLLLLLDASVGLAASESGVKPERSGPIPPGLRCPARFYYLWEYSAVEHEPLVPLAGLRRGLVCRYSGAPNGIPIGPSPFHPSRLLGRRVLKGPARVADLAEEVDRLRGYASSGEVVGGDIFASPGAFLAFEYGRSHIVRLTVYFKGQARVTSGEDRQWFEPTPALIRRIRDLTPST
jgi:hypothetical protein